ncbi:MAG: DnaB-like helicase N-terminal domain-containing protein, partial [Butyricicoccaceae bacterium]
EAAELLAELDNEIEREVHTARVAKDTGVSQKSLQIQVEKALNRRKQRQKTQLRREVRAPAQQAQPASRELRYDNVPAARAEEGMISLILADNTLLERIRARITPEDFSAPALRDIFEKMCRMDEERHPITITAFEGQLSPEQMDLLTGIPQRYRTPRDRRAQALEDYLEMMQKTRLSRQTTAAEGQDPLLNIAAFMKKKKGYQGPQA